MARKLGLTAAWVAATLVSMFIAAQAVGGVGEQITDRPASLPDLVEASALPAVTNPEAAAATTAISATSTVTQEPTVPPGVTATTVGPPPTAEPVPTTTPATVPPTTNPSGGENPQASTSTTTSTTTTSTTTTTTAAPLERSQHLLTGGIVVLDSRPGEVYLASASPNLGYEVKVEKTGPESVEVEFVSTGETPYYEGELHAEWRDGELDVDIEERFSDED